MKTRFEKRIEMLKQFERDRMKLKMTHRIEFALLEPLDRIQRINLRTEHLCQILDLRIALLYKLSEMEIALIEES